jgi:hypothetical protein
MRFYAMATAAHIATARDIVDLSNEIWMHHSPQPLGMTVERCADGLDDPALHDEYLKLPFYVANETLDTPLQRNRPQEQPRRRLARRVLDFARHIGKRHMPPVADLRTASLYEEFSFATSMAYHNYEVRDAAPAIIFSDVHGVPTGYQKAHGEPLTYIWRDAFIPTEAGARAVPADSLVRMIYQPGGELQEQLKGLGLVAVRNFQPLDVEFVRFNINNLPGKMYATILDSCIEQEPRMTAYTKGVRQLDPILAMLRLARANSPEKVVAFR